jgi:hypothetical protein
MAMYRIATVFVAVDASCILYTVHAGMQVRCTRTTALFASSLPADR